MSARAWSPPSGATWAAGENVPGGLVTNAQGKVISRVFAEHGDQVVISDYDPARAEASADVLRSMGADPFIVNGDMTRMEEMQKIADAVISKFKRVDALVNTQGTIHNELLLKLTDPGGKPLQTTRDLPAFWRGSWRDVVKDMKGRYPKHRWPDEPWNEAASLKTKNAFNATHRA